MIDLCRHSVALLKTFLELRLRMNLWARVLLMDAGVSTGLF
jgi:hypothetical protein